MQAALRVLTFTSLFPSVARPRHGIFVETRLRHLLAHGGIDARVIAPVPWFPSRAQVFGQYARFAATPRHEVREGGLKVTHPRYWMVPKFGVSFQPDSMARAAAVDILKWQREGWSPELIDAHYLYPDGVAAAILAARFGVPFVMTARGTDVNVLARTPGTAERILWAAERAHAVITVSSRLMESLVEAGVSPARLTVLRNGVDPVVFDIEKSAAARQRLGLPPGRLAACVGNLVPEKGFELAIEALAHEAELALVIVGDGPARAGLEALARRLGMLSRVHFVPTMPQHDLRHLYSAVDLLFLTSWREGWPNVVLEAMACGTPVAAVDVGAVGDMITSSEVGRIVLDRNPASLARAASDILSAASRRERIRLHALQFDWASIAASQIEIMRAAVNVRGMPSALAGWDNSHPRAGHVQARPPTL